MNETAIKLNIIYDRSDLFTRSPSKKNPKIRVKIGPKLMTIAIVASFQYLKE